MVLKLTRDDLGVLRLKEANAAKTTAPLSSLTATAGIGPQSSPHPSAPTTAPEERRHGDRRQGHERRGQNRQAIVLLDTRSHYERRTHERRHNATAADREQQHLPHGIDIHI